MNETTTAPLPPLRFHPLLRRALWGGRRLGTELHKAIGPENDYAESWEIADLPGWESQVADGPLQGLSLRQLMTTRRDALLGRHADRDRFPLLAKFLDAHKRLSVQVHPLGDGALPGKAEIWVVVDAAPGSRLAAGLAAGVTTDDFTRALQQGEIDPVLNLIEVRAGDVIFLPSGVVHALGGGLLVAEIQEPEDTTYRLFDWNRLDRQGQPRPLHLQRGLQAIDYAAGPISCVAPQQLSAPGGPELLVDCESFVVRRYARPGSFAFAEDDRAHLLMALAGEITVASGPDFSLKKGETLLLPARRESGAVQLDASAILLDAFLR